MKEANRMKRLPPYLFTIVDNLKKQVRAEGKDVIDLSMGNPDMPTPLHIVEKLCEAAHEKVNHRYSKRDDECERSLRKAICIWYKNRFDVDLDPETEVVPLIGSKEGIAHLSTAFLNPDDIALVPSPAYPVHFNGVIMAGGILYNLPLLRENDYLPILDTIPAEVLSRSKLMFLSYPHNPTAAVADRSFYEKIVKWIRGKDIILASDAAYSDITYDGHEPTSILQIEGAKDVAIEFHTLSKSYNMAGWRLGFAVGNASILSSLEKTKSYTDFGIFRPIQHAAIEALTGDQSSVTDLVARYKEKYSALSSLDFSSLMLREIGVATAPGTGFGEYGEGYVRFALVVDLPLLEEALVRIKEFISI
jgi:LL-diaminopimelate aminotransferase